MYNIVNGGTANVSNYRVSRTVVIFAGEFGRTPILDCFSFFVSTPGVGTLWIPTRSKLLCCNACSVDEKKNNEI